MNKTRIVLSVTGGIIALAVLALSFLTWCAFSNRAAAFEGDEENEGLETVVGQIAGLMNKKPFPNKANKKRIDANIQTLEDWYASVRRAAARGDWRADADCSAAQFKEIIGRGAKGVAALRGAEGKPFVPAEFAFGPFKDYLADKMPAKDQLARLQRQWYDFQSFVQLLTTNGVVCLTDFQAVERAAQPAPQKPKGQAKAKKATASAEGDQPSVETYQLSFQAKPEALFGVIRDLSFQERFTVVDSLSFSRERDVIVEMLGGGEEKKEPAAAGRRGRRRPVVADAKKDDGEKKAAFGSVVFDPAADSKLNVVLTVSVYDFRSLEDDEKGAAK